MKLQSHNLSITPEVIHYDDKGNKIKSISFPQQSFIDTDDSNIELTLYESDGTVKDVFICPFRSFTHNFARTIMSRSYVVGATTVNLIDTGGTLRTQASYNNLWGFNAPAPANTSTYGIQVGASGSATATASLMSNALSGLINHGTTAGTLQYSIQTFDSSLTEISGSYMWSTSRTFTNASAANVNVKEVGLVSNTYNSSYKILYARDVVDSNGNAINVTVAPTQVLTVKYNIFAPRAGGIHRNLVAYHLSTFSETQIANSINSLGRDDYITTAAGDGVNQHYEMMLNAGVGVAWNGIMVGTGDATESLDILNTEIGWITHGSGSAEELMYGANQTDGAKYVFSTSGSAVEWILKRTFTNAFADPITVREAVIVTGNDSLYANGLKTGGSKWLMARKLIGDNVINSGSSLEVQFKFMLEA